MVIDCLHHKNTGIDIGIKLDETNLILVELKQEWLHFRSSISSCELLGICPDGIVVNTY